MGLPKGVSQDVPSNLKPRQFQILGLLHDHGGLAQRELVDEMGVAPSILVTLLNPLEADGLVARERDPDDPRRHLVTLTSAGEKQLAGAARAQKDAEDALFASFDDDEREHLRAMLITLRDGLAADPEAAAPRPRPRSEARRPGRHRRRRRSGIAQRLWLMTSTLCPSGSRTNAP